MTTLTQQGVPPATSRHVSSRSDDGVVARPQPISRKIVVATVAGNAMEFYDFSTYAFFAVYIGKTFFPSTSPLTSLLLSVAVFGVGFVTRPLGGILIGAFADRVGRKPAMLLTITLITVGTLGLAVTPSYASIGIAAPIIVVLCRLVQGLALGGEVGPSTAYLIEIAPLGRRGLYGSWQLASQGVASLAAGIVGVVLTLSLSPEQMLAWGWRMPFLLGLLLIPIAIFLRRSMPETLAHSPTRSVDQTPVRIGNHTRSVVIAVLLILGTTVSTYAAIYMTTYAITTLKLSPVIGMTSTIIFGLATWGGALLGGWLSDRYGRKPVMLWPRVALLLLTYPAFMVLIQYTNFFTLACVTTLLASLTAISGAASVVTIPEQFPSHVRALGLSIAYAVGVTLFGGTAQLVIAWLIAATGNPAAPAMYVVLTSVITLYAIMVTKETGGDKPLQR